MSTTCIELDLTAKEIEQLREVMDALPLNPFAPLINKVLAALPFTESAGPTSAGTAVVPGPDSPGFQLHACTEKGRERLPDVLRRLLQTGESL